MAELSQTGASGEGDTDSGTKDIEYIRGIIQKEIQGLAKDLVDEHICAGGQSVTTAEDILLKRADLQSNAGIKDTVDHALQWIKDRIKKRREKIPSFLFISAPMKNPKGSIRRENEETQRECEAKNFTKLYGMDSDQYRTIKVVDNHAQMLEEIKAFVSVKKLSELPFVVFLGHGTPCGQLCFYQEPWVFCLQALNDVYKCFKENKLKKMPSFQLRVVFAQCYGHLVDENDAPGEIQECGVEYTYITSEDNKESHSDVKAQVPQFDDKRSVILLHVYCSNDNNEV